MTMRVYFVSFKKKDSIYVIADTFREAYNKAVELLEEDDEIRMIGIQNEEVIC